MCVGRWVLLEDESNNCCCCGCDLIGVLVFRRGIRSSRANDERTTTIFLAAIYFVIWRLLILIDDVYYVINV